MNVGMGIAMGVGIGLEWNGIVGLGVKLKVGMRVNNLL